MNTEAPALIQSTHKRITAPINTTVEFDPPLGRGSKETILPAHLGTPVVSWGFDEDNTIHTDITLNIKGDPQQARFWSQDEDGPGNTAQAGYRNDRTNPWQALCADDFHAAVAWSEGIHKRIVDGARQVTEAAAPHGSEAYNAVIRFAAGHSIEEPVLEVHGLGENGDRWLVTGTTEDTDPTRIRTEVGKWLIETLGVQDDQLPALLTDVKNAELTFRGNWVMEPVAASDPDGDRLLKRDEEADHNLPRFAGTLVTI